MLQRSQGPKDPLSKSSKT